MLPTPFSLLLIPFCMHKYMQVQIFINHISGPSSLYGLQQATLDSLVLSLLPPATCTHLYFSMGTQSDGQWP